MDKATVRARMKSGLADLMRKEFGDLEAKDIAFYESIDGKEVTLVFTGKDAFEQQDDNYWLPDHTWEELT